jgi:hypothetical protein
VSIRKNPIAYLALFIALGGTSYAAVALPANSVGARQLRNGAVTNAKVKAHSLAASALASGVIPKLDVALHTEFFIGAYAGASCGPTGCPAPAIGSTLSYNANCPVGTQVVGGGFVTYRPQSAVVSASRPIKEGQGEPIAGAGGGWQVVFTVTATDLTLADGAGDAYVVCAALSS